MDAILDAARDTGANAIHPGYGLLSENGEFARRVQEAGLIFVGPSPEVITQMGEARVTARRRMEEAGIPVVPGSNGICDFVRSIPGDRPDRISVDAESQRRRRWDRNGVLRSEADLEKAFASAQGRAQAYFGDKTLFMEPFYRIAANTWRCRFSQMEREEHCISLNGNALSSAETRRWWKRVHPPPSGLKQGKPFAGRQSRGGAAKTVGYTGAGDG